MCTVLQQYLRRQTPTGNNVCGRESSKTPIPLPPLRCSTPATVDSSLHGTPRGTTDIMAYSYILHDVTSSLKRPIDQAERRIRTPTPHYHVPQGNGRLARSSYLANLYGRSRSHSRSGMRYSADKMRWESTEKKSNYLNNRRQRFQQGLSEYAREKKEENCSNVHSKRPFLPYSDPERLKRHWSEPSLPEQFSDDDQALEDNEGFDTKVDYKDVELDLRATELSKISSGMGKVFLIDLAIERELRQRQRHRLMDPRSAARTPAANREPSYGLRYDSPVNASPSRIADHNKSPWDTDCDTTIIEGRPNSLSRRSFLPHYPIGGVVSPIYVTKRGQGQKSSTLPSRLSLSEGETPLGYESSTDVRGGGHSTPYSTTDLSSKSDGSEKSSSDDFYSSGAVNVYPLHLLVTTNYRLPGDVNRKCLERYLCDEEFEDLFKMTRGEFYRLIPKWKRDEMKRRLNLF